MMTDVVAQAKARSMARSGSFWYKFKNGLLVAFKIGRAHV